jgi:curved DNA-binding protein CbpA
LAKTHYDTLGVKHSATPDEVRSAYRKIVLVHHPDRSRDPRSPAIFIAATEAYEVLSDPEARSRYDEAVERDASRAKQILEEQRRADEQRRAAASSPRPGWSEVRIEAVNINEEIRRMQGLFARGNHIEAESLARRIAAAAPRNPIAYAVLGDIARVAGNVNEAAKMYAYAAQFEPSNAVYQRRYEELLNSSRVVVDHRQTTTLSHHDRNILVPGAAGLLVFLAAAVCILAPGPPVFHKLAPISTWTLGLPIALFLSGVFVGGCFAAGRLFDRFEAVSSSTSGAMGPVLPLTLVALINFWAAVLLYLVLGLLHRGWNFSISRLLTGVGGALLLLTLLAPVGSRTILPLQLLAWGGNVVYLGALLGWLVADTIRP